MQLEAAAGDLRVRRFSRTLVHSKDQGSIAKTLHRTPSLQLRAFGTSKAKAHQLQPRGPNNHIRTCSQHVHRPKPRLRNNLRRLLASQILPALVQERNTRETRVRTMPRGCHHQRCQWRKRPPSPTIRPRHMNPHPKRLLLQKLLSKIHNLNMVSLRASTNRNPPTPTRSPRTHGPQPSPEL